MSAFKISLLKSGVHDAIVVIDREFASQSSNIEALEKGEFKSIIPLQRDSRPDWVVS